MFMLELVNSVLFNASSRIEIVSSALQSAVRLLEVRYRLVQAVGTAGC